MWYQLEGTCLAALENERQKFLNLSRQFGTLHAYGALVKIGKGLLFLITQCDCTIFGTSDVGKDYIYSITFRYWKGRSWCKIPPPIDEVNSTLFDPRLWERLINSIKHGGRSAWCNYFMMNKSTTSSNVRIAWMGRDKNHRAAPPSKDFWKR